MPAPKRMKLPKIPIVFALLAATVITLAHCNATDKTASSAESTPANFSDFAGSVSCASCHRDIYEKHLHTEHFLSTAKTSAKNIRGSFEEGKNRYRFSSGATVVMERTDSGFYQTEYANERAVKTERMDIVVGSGRKGQSYIHISGNRFVQLPVTYFTAAAQWSNSPGYPPRRPVFDRPVTARCLECHATFVQQEKRTPAASVEAMDAGRLIYGIACEKCHGPGARHVAFQSQNRQATKAKFIINPAKLSRQQNLDLCSLCHGGRLEKTAASFSFQAGDTLSKFFALNKNVMAATNIDVHGNQAGLLSVSKCFERSQLTCNSCHSPHEAEKENIALFSQRCQSCHNGHQKVCKLTQSMGAIITQNCIDCHMPKQASHAIAVYLQGADRPTPVMMRTHWVKIYPDETEKVKAFLRTTKAGVNKKAQGLR